MAEEHPDWHRSIASIRRDMKELSDEGKRRDKMLGLGWGWGISLVGLMVAIISVILTTFALNARRIDRLSIELAKAREEISVLYEGDSVLKEDIAGVREYLGKRIDDVHKRIDTVINMIQLTQQR